MHRLLLYFFAGSLFTACQPKSIPSKSEELKPVNASSIKKPLVVIDNLGRVITTKKMLPIDENITPDYSQLERGYTPEQQARLMVRHKIMPPKVLYVPKSLIKTSLKGDYYVYQRKFWYWKKSDGLFHLDVVYYQ
jgi:hypothetical protein